MSIGNIRSKSIDYKDLPGPIPSTTVTPYTRPAGWLTLPTLLTTDYKFVGLYAIFENANYVAFQVTNTGGSYYVDWGDGTNNTYATGAIASHEYDYSTYDTSNTTLITRNNLTYKQAIITVTPLTVNNITIMYLHTPHPSNLQTTYATNWLDISVNMPTMTTFTITNGVTTIKPWLLEQITVGVLANNNSYGSMFQYCSALKNVIIDTSFTFISCANMFYGCSALQTIPSFNTASCTNMSYMFYNCYSLVSLPSTFNTSSNTNSNLMFNNCYALVSLPPIKVGANGSSMFQNCKSLKTVILNTTATNTMTLMFNGCTNLEESPILATPSLYIANSMFNACTNLKKVNLFNTSNVTDMAYMFYGCSALASVPTFNTVACTTMAYMFYNCFSLVSVPSFNTVACTNMTYMFYSCTALTSVPSFNTPACTIMSYMFYNCNSLTSVPSFNTSNVTTMIAMFQNCYELLSVPSLNTIKVTDMSYMFFNCSALSSVPTFNTVACTNMTAMFQNCFTLSSIPTFNTVACINFSNMFQTSGMVTIPALVTTAGGLGGFGLLAANCYNLQKFNMSIRGATSFASTRLNKTQLESIFTNAALVASAQIITITGATGADSTSITLSSATTAGTKTMSTTNTTGLAVGMYYSSTGSGIITGLTMTTTTGTNIFTWNSHGFSNGDAIFLSTVTTTTSLTTYTVYYVINSTLNTFQVSLTSGGAAVTMNASGSAVVRYTCKVVSFVTNSSITLDTVIAQATSGTVSFRKLNIFQALAKRYTITG